MNIENKKQFAIILLAIGLGLVSAVLTGNYIQKNVQTETERLAQDFEMKRVKPLEHTIVQMQADIKKLASRPVQVVQQAPERVEPAQPVIPKSALALNMPLARRAYTVRIDSLSAVGGLINPGDFVDVLGHLDIPNPEEKKTQSVSSILFQNIQILAVGTNMQSTGSYEAQQAARSLNLTFALTPEEAGLMSFVEKHGRMQLLLRAPAATEVEIIQPANWAALADYVFEKQGTDLVIPREKAAIIPVAPPQQEEVKPFIQIFSGGRKL